MKRIHHEQTARFCQAMGNPARITILSFLAQGFWSVGQLADEIGESIAGTSAHLKVLRNAHLIEVEKKGREVWCRVKSAEVIAAIASVQSAARAVLPEFREMDKAAEQDPFLLEGADLKDIAKQVKAGRVTLVDLRPEQEFLAGHLPKAISKPFSLLSKADLSDLKGRGKVVGYCRGPWCKKAFEGVGMLNKRGIPSLRLKAGVIEWQAAGLPLEN